MSVLQRGVDTTELSLQTSVHGHGFVDVTDKTVGSHVVCVNTADHWWCWPDYFQSVTSELIKSWFYEHAQSEESIPAENSVPVKKLPEVHLTADL